MALSGTTEGYSVGNPHQYARMKLILVQAVRILLGVFEAGLYPGVVFYLSWLACVIGSTFRVLINLSWYKRSELGIRVAVFFSAASVAGAFSAYFVLLFYCADNSSGGLLAAAIENMNGVGGRPGWAWIFILEGLVTIICAVASFWMIADFPDTAKFLTEQESVYSQPLTNRRQR